MRLFSILRRVGLHWQIFIALGLGILLGYSAPDKVIYVRWMGDLFLRSLSMVVMPLIISSIITGVASLGGGETMGRLSVKAIAYYIGTSLLAILTGLFLVNLFQPGIGAEKVAATDAVAYPETKTFSDLLIDIVPSNVFEAIVNNNTLSVIFFSILFGIFLTRIPTKSQRVLLDFFNAVFDVIMKLTSFLVRLAPLGVFGIVAGVVADNNKDLGLFFGSLGKYSLVVLGGIFIHFFVSLPLLVRFIGRANPYRHMRNMRNALLTAFSTSSSGVTLPLTIDGVVSKSGVSSRISNFMLPLGATINMDGTALYECVAVIYLAQLLGIELSFGTQAIIVVTALLASIGAASIPMAGLIMLKVVIAAAGLPEGSIVYIIAVDRILDMFRTATNVWGDACGAVLIAKTEGEKTLV